MKITVEVKPSAREEKIEKISEAHFRVSVKAPPKEDKANRAVEDAIARHFGIAPSLVVVSHGKTSRTKIVTIPD